MGMTREFPENLLHARRPGSIQDFIHGVKPLQYLDFMLVCAIHITIFHTYGSPQLTERYNRFKIRHTRFLIAAF